MVEYAKEKQIKGLLERNIHAKKGDHGRVLIIGADDSYVGALGLAGLAALRTGADSVRIAAPQAAARILNAYSPDLVTTKLAGEELDERHLKELSSLSLHADVVLLGPGWGVGTTRARLLEKLLPLLHCPAVLDADATKQVHVAHVSNAIILANANEYEQLRKTNGLEEKELRGALTSNVLAVKGKEDRILTPEKELLVYGGTPAATVNGTGDVLAGVAAALQAQLKNAYLSAEAACLITKKAAEKAFATHHYGMTASDLLAAIPAVTRDYRVYRETKHDPNPKKRNGK